MNESDALDVIRNSGSVILSTREFSMLANISSSFASQMLRRLAAKKKLTRLFQGLWADTQNPHFSPYQVVPFLTRPHLAAVSLLSALHLHGMIEQIPQVIYVVSTALTKKVKTPVGDYSIHQISPDFFEGYEYYPAKDFLMASPEKALVDCVYLSARKRNRFVTLPEIYFPKNFSRRRAFVWVNQIAYPRLREAVRGRLDKFLFINKSNCVSLKNC